MNTSKGFAICCLPFALLAIGCGSGGGDGGSGDANSGPSGGPGASVGSGSGSDCMVAAQNLAVSDAPGITPAILFSGKNYAVVWATPANDAIRIALLDAMGTKSTEQVVASGAGLEHPTITHLQNGGYLVLWEQKNGTTTIFQGRHVDETGVPQSMPYQLTTASTTDGGPSAASTSAGIAIAWMDAANVLVGFADVGNPIANSASLGGAYPALAAADQGAGLALTKSQGGQPGFALLSGPGAALNPTWLAGQASNPSLVYEGNRFAMAWEDTQTGTEQIQFALIDNAGKIAGPALISRDSSSANWPHTAWTGSYSAVTYYQFRDGPPKIYLTLVGNDLKPVGQDVEVSADMAGKFPTIAWSGSELGIAFTEKTNDTDGIVRLSICNCPMQ